MDKAGRNRKIGSIAAAAGALLMLAAVALTVYNLWDEARAEKTAGEVLGEILDEMEYDAPEEYTAPGENVASEEYSAPAENAEPVKNDGPEVSAEPEIGWSEGANMPTIVLNGEAYIGILEIPSLGLALPIRDDWSYPNLRKTPCRYTGGLYSHDMVIAGHNYDSHFGRLKTLQIGDEVYFTDIDENRVAYYVSEVDTLSPTDIDKMTAIGEWDITLFTCTVGGRSRVTVRCTMQW